MPVRINMSSDAVKELEEQLAKSGNGDLFIGQNLLNPTLYIRLFPGHPNIGTIPHMIEKGYWIDNKRYVSPSTFNKPCPIAEELSEAKAYITEASKSNKPEHIERAREMKHIIDSKVAFKDVYMFPACKMLVQDERTWSFSGIDGDMVKVLQVGSQLGKAILRIVVNPPGCTVNDLYDPNGHIIQLKKSGNGMKTEYTAQMIVNKWQISEALYEYDKIPDIYELTRKKVKSDEYLRGVIRHYLYGESMPADESVKHASASESTLPQPTVIPQPIVIPQPTVIPQPSLVSQASQTTAAQPAQKQRRSLLDDLRS